MGVTNGTTAPVLDRRATAHGGRRANDRRAPIVEGDDAIDPPHDELASVTHLTKLETVRRPRSIYARVAKPLLDRVLGSLGLAAAALPMAIIAGCILVSMGRPVLFRQRRVGRDGEVFEVLKFRTMRPDRRASAMPVIHDRRLTHKTVADPRHTPFGRVLRKYSLDELPQLINVVRGEMSIVGPRPELESVVARYRPGLDQRHYVKPGLTGLWQISARGDGPMHENGEWDLEYVERISFLTDLTTILRTPAAMLGERSGS